MESTTRIVLTLEAHVFAAEAMGRTMTFPFRVSWIFELLRVPLGAKSAAAGRGRLDLVIHYAIAAYG